MCQSMVNIQSPTAEIRRGKKRRKKERNSMKILWSALLHRATIISHIHTAPKSTSESQAQSTYLLTAPEPARGRSRLEAKFQTAKVIFKVTQGHWYWCHSTGYVWFPISLPLPLCLYLVLFPRYYHVFPKVKEVTDHKQNSFGDVFFHTCAKKEKR